MGLVVADDGWRIPDEVWAQMEPLLPERPAHPLGCHNPRVPDREAMNAILLVLRTGMQWNALSATGICSCSSAYRRSRGEEAQALKREAGFRARRWVVERTQSWLNRFRRILVRWEKRADTYLAMLHLACGLITWRAANWGRLAE